MKRAILLILFLMMFLNISHAEDERWINIYQGKNGASAYLDQSTVKEYISNNGALYIECWVKLRYPENNLNIDFTINHNYFKLSKNNANPYLTNEIIFFDSKGNVIQQSNSHNKGWLFPVPNSVIEKIINNTFVWVSENMKDEKIQIGTVGPTTNIDE